MPILTFRLMIPNWNLCGNVNQRLSRPRVTSPRFPSRQKIAICMIILFALFLLSRQLMLPLACPLLRVLCVTRLSMHEVRVSALVRLSLIRHISWRIALVQRGAGSVEIFQLVNVFRVCLLGHALVHPNLMVGQP